MKNETIKNEAMKMGAIFPRIFWLIFGLVIFYFGWLGLTTGVWEGDSLAYHLPIARNLLAFKFSDFPSLLEYYPATVHVLLAGMMALHLPLGWFNVFGLIFLVSGGYFLARQAGLRQGQANVFAVTISLLTPMARLISTQTVDIYLAGFYAFLLGLCLKPRTNLSYFGWLGLMAGGLLGAKYTGPLFLLALTVFFAGGILQKATLKAVFLTLSLIAVVGGFWYARNFFLMGDIFYPANHSDFTWVKWHTWQTIFISPGGWWYFLESLLSEYLWWGGLLVTLPFLFLAKAKQKPLGLEIKLIFLGLINFAIHLLIPASIHNVLSDLRYATPTFIVLILAAFLLASNWKKTLELNLVCLLSVLASFALIIPHRPKIFVLYGLVVGGGFLLKALLDSFKKPNF